MQKKMCRKEDKYMKKFLALILALVMALSLVACGGGTTTEPDDTDTPDDTNTPEVITDANEIADEMTSEDGKYEIGFVTDVGQLKDKSFNQGTYDGVKLYAAANGLSYKYYQPANGDKATDDDRYDAMKAACDNGAKAVVCAGFMQGPALEKVAAEYPDVAFIFIDGWSTGANVAGIAFAEEQSGYLAGYAVVKEGFEKLGFTGGGGGTNPACVRFGYGFVQGANDAAKELGKTVDINYTWQFGNTFSPSPELMAMVSGWYNAGTEIVFCCGGNMFQSVAQAAAENDGAVVGVDTDQSFESETVVTSATKGLSSAVQWALAKVYDGTFSEIGGNSTSLGVAENSVGLPTATWSMQNFTVEEYEALFQKILNGEVTIDNNSEMSNPAEAGLTNITVNFVA